VDFPFDANGNSTHVHQTMAAAVVIDTPFGHSLPPEGPHTVTMHAPGWTTALRFRDGDLTIINQLKSIYPRFFPFGPAAQVFNHVLAPSWQLRGATDSV